MKRQKYPVSIINLGAVIYDVSTFTYEGKTEIEVRHWHVRSIQRKSMGHVAKHFANRLGIPRDDTRYVGLTCKNEFTWVRLSKKVADYGWSKSISRWHRKKFTVGDDLPIGCYTTILQALKYALLDTQDTLTKTEARQAVVVDPSEWAEWEEDVSDAKKEIRALKMRITKLKRGKFA